MDSEKKMNICFLTAEVPNLLTGGIENVTYQLAAGFRNRGHNVYCLTLDEYKKADKDLPFVHLCIGREKQADNVVKDFLQKNSVDVVINQAVEERWKLIVAKIKGELPNVKYIKALHTDPASMIKGVIDREPLYTEGNSLLQLIYRINPVTIIRRRRRREYTRTLYREWLSLYDRVVLLSEAVIADFYRLANVEPCGKVLAISNPVEFKQASESTIKKENIILYVGRLYREAKRPDRLIAIWERIYKKFPTWKLIIVGDGPMRQEIEAYVKEQHIKRVELVGQQDPAPYYDRASILCITSTYEGFSLVCAECKAYNVIPIAFESYGAIADLIQNKYNGVLAPPFKLNEYASLLSNLLDDTYFRCTMQSQIACDKDFFEKFKLGNIIIRWEKLFKEIYS